MSAPRRGEIWLADLDPTADNEVAGQRPVLVMSSDAFHNWPIHLAIVVPLTTSSRPLRHHTPVVSGGLDRPSVARPEDVRSITTRRFTRRLGVADPSSVETVADSLRDFLEL
ncbi:type II toxin-antitoxin system PemK/MazF family toxin [Fodinicola feengrottensis]|uniref:mRNA interferase n=1 Tax=Fodinicola feengrottensis TaxID=435914 RepID=A0ABN2I6I4_9ACTN|nr:type II toxin-antitoxin system PemK/MazF family toxin [Fodinicola feengrottensis]